MPDGYESRATTCSAPAGRPGRVPGPRPGRRSGADSCPRGHRGPVGLDVRPVGVPACEAQAGALLHRVERDGRRRQPARGSRLRAARPPRRLLGAAARLHRQLRDQEGHAAVGGAVQVDGRSPRALLPRPRRAGVRRVERGQPRQPADVSQPDAGRAVLPPDGPHGQAALLDVRGGGARRARPDRRRALHGQLVPGVVGDLSSAGHAGGHPQLRRRQPCAHDLHAQHHPRVAQAQRRDQVLVHRDGRDREVRAQLSVQHVARRQPAEEHVRAGPDLSLERGGARVRLQLDRRRVPGALRRGADHPGGSTRPAYTVLRQQLPHFLR
jgi:hypothetical protein